MIGVNIPDATTPPQGVPISTKIAQGAVVLSSVAAAQAVGPIIQGAEEAVIPQADLVTAKLPPPVAGGLQFELVVLATASQPEPLSQQQLDLEQSE